MNKKEIEKDYKKKIRLIKNYNKFYYDKNNPAVLDSVYDELKRNTQQKLDDNKSSLNKLSASKLETLSKNLNAVGRAPSAGEN